MPVVLQLQPHNGLAVREPRAIPNASASASDVVPGAELHGRTA